MTLHIYDTLRAQKRPFEPINEGHVRMYVCGALPKGDCHVDDLRSCLVWDMVYRYLRYSGYEVTYVRHIGDIDRDIPREAADQNHPQRRETGEHMQGDPLRMNIFGLHAPTVEPKATNAIPDIISLIGQLEEQGYAYCLDGDVYFDVERFEAYGKLSMVDFSTIKSIAHPQDGGPKKSPLDFILWHSEKAGEMSWESPWGRGQPSRDIECTAVSMATLGRSYDLHCGSQSLMFPHHENHNGQSACATGTHVVSYWMHNGITHGEGEGENASQAKSNLSHIHHILTAYEPQVLRFFLMTTAHYRRTMDMRAEALDEAAARVAYFYETLRKAKALARSAPEFHFDALPNAELIDSCEDQFSAAMDDDFNISKVLVLLSEIFKVLNELASTRKPMKIPGAAVSARTLLASIEKIDEVLNLFTAEPEPYLVRHRMQAAQRLGLSTDWIEKRISERIAARTARDYASADLIHHELKTARVVLMDHAGGTDWTILETEPAEEAHLP